MGVACTTDPATVADAITALGAGLLWREVHARAEAGMLMLRVPRAGLMAEAVPMDHDGWAVTVHRVTLGPCADAGLFDLACEVYRLDPAHPAVVVLIPVPARVGPSPDGPGRRVGMLILEAVEAVLEASGGGDRAVTGLVSRLAGAEAYRSGL